MSKKDYIQIIIDASVARSAGETNHPTSLNCRSFLQEFRATNHKIYMTPKISEEWNKHQSKFSLQLRTHLIARKRWVYVKDEENLEVREVIQRMAASEKVKKEVDKDIHLVEAAIKADNIVVSNDDKMRRMLGDLSIYSTELRNICWINPINEAEDSIGWLKDGCKKENSRKLCHNPVAMVAAGKDK
ncbi:hypothetical protein [Paenibacillus chitinolyticus]